MGERGARCQRLMIFRDTESTESREGPGEAGAP